MPFDDADLGGREVEMEGDEGDDALVGEILLGLFSHGYLEVIRRYLPQALLPRPCLHPDLDVHKAQYTTTPSFGS